MAEKRRADTTEEPCVSAAPRMTARFGWGRRRRRLWWTWRVEQVGGVFGEFLNEWKGREGREIGWVFVLWRASI